MKLPWNKKYLTIGFHVVIGFGAIYATKLILDGMAYIFTNLSDSFNNIGVSFGWMMGLFTPLVIGLILAYLLDPVVDFLQSTYEWLAENKLPLIRPKNNNSPPKFRYRTAGTILTYVSMILLIVILILWIANRLKIEGGFITASISAMEESREQFTQSYAKFQIQLEKLGLLQFASHYLSQIIDSIATFLQDILNTIASSLSSAGGGILQFFLGLVVAFYLLRGKDELKSGIVKITDIFLPIKACSRAKSILSDVNHILSGYIRGQLIDSVIMSFLISIYLSIVNVEFSLIIGIFAGFSNVIPYFGAFFGIALSAIVAFLSGDAIKALYAAIGVFILQQIDSLIITPRVVGKNVELSPLTIIITISIAASLFGVVGMILAVPICAIAKLFLVRYMKYKQRMREQI